jgi:hypothetical protein
MFDFSISQGGIMVSDNETLQDAERTGPFLEVDRSVEEFLLKQEISKQRSVTHADVARIMRELGHELSYDQRIAILHRLKARAVYQRAIRYAVGEEVGLEEIRPFIEVSDWPVILPPEVPGEGPNIEWCHRLVETLKQNGWRPNERG